MRASNAHRWGTQWGCTASIELEEKYESFQKSDDQAFGIKCHNLAEECLIRKNHTPLDNVTGAERDVVLPYVTDFIEKYKDFEGKKRNIAFEQKLRATRIHNDLMPIIDAHLYVPECKYLCIWEFKAGHKTVEVENNLQMICGFCAIEEKFDIIDDQNLTVEFRIVQPRSYHSDGPIRNAIYKASDFRGAINTLSMRANSDHRDQVTGTHCYGCQAIMHCDAAIKNIYTMYETIQKLKTVDITNDQLAINYELLNHIKEKINYILPSTEVEMMERIKKGQLVKGYEITPSTGRIEWDCGVDKLKNLQNMLNVPLLKESPITPKQAIKAGVSEKIINKIASRKNNGYKLSKISKHKIKELFT